MYNVQQWVVHLKIYESRFHVVFLHKKIKFKKKGHYICISKWKSLTLFNPPLAERLNKTILYPKTLASFRDLKDTSWWSLSSFTNLTSVKTKRILMNQSRLPQTQPKITQNISHQDTFTKAIDKSSYILYCTIVFSVTIRTVQIYMKWTIYICTFILCCENYPTMFYK